MITAYFDGASWPNPGHSACGSWAHIDGKVLFEHSEYLGTYFTNNYAEYSGLCSILRWLLKNNIQKRVHIYGDSEFVINQILGKWKIREPEKNQPPKIYVSKALEARKLLTECIAQGCEINFTWIRRNKNTKADELATATLRTQGIKEVVYAPKTTSKKKKKFWKKQSRNSSLSQLLAEQRADRNYSTYLPSTRSSKSSFSGKDWHSRTSKQI